MNNSRNDIPSAINTAGHLDIPPGQSTSSTDGSSPQLSALPRPDTSHLSPNSSSTVAESARSSVTLLENLADYRYPPSGNAFAAERARRIAQGNAERAGQSVGLGISAGSDPDGEAQEDASRRPPSLPQLSNLTTTSLSPLVDGNTFSSSAGPAGDQRQLQPYATTSDTHAARAVSNPAEARNANNAYTPSDPDLRIHRLHHVSSIASLTTPRPTVHATTFGILSAPQATHVEVTRDELPVRPEPAARTTLQRMQRGWHNLTGGGNMMNEGTEMTTFRRASVSHPRLYRDGEAREQRDREHQAQRENDGLVQVPPVQQAPQQQSMAGAETSQFAQTWGWVGSFVAAGTVCATIIGGVIYFGEKSK